MHILITGATGFVAQSLIPHLLKQGFHIVAAIRNSEGIQITHQNVRYCNVGAINAETKWQAALTGIDIVIHLAARVHVMHDPSLDPFADFHEVNVAGSVNLAQQAIAAKVSRFIFISSIKVNGEFTQEKPFTINDVPAPVDAYGQSKHKAEMGLRQVLTNTPTELVILRLPLVYGPGMKGNLAILEKTIRRHIPLPLGLVANKRDLISIYNLCDIIKKCLDHKYAAGQIFLVADGEPLSSKELIKSIGKGIGKIVFLLPVPVIIMKMVLGLLGKSVLINRLFGNLEVDITETKRILQWTPQYSVEQSFGKMYAD